VSISNDKMISSIHETGTIERMQPAKGKPTPAPVGKPFDEILKQQLESPKGVVFSAHARDRLIHRNINLTPHDLERLQNGIQQAAGKGSQESLVLMNELAFVVSVPNRTVITAMTGDTLKGNVFTQIDSAVIL